MTCHVNDDGGGASKPFNILHTLRLLLPSQPKTALPTPSLLVTQPPFSCIQSSLFPPAFPTNIPRFHGSPSQKLDLMDLHQTHFAQATFSLRAFFTPPCATLRLHPWKKKQTLNGFLRSRRAFYLNLFQHAQISRSLARSSHPLPCFTLYAFSRFSKIHEQMTKSTSTN